MKRVMISASSTGVGLFVLGAAVVLARPQVSAPTGYPADGQAPIVKLLSAGAEPRRPIRYAITNGRKEHLTLDLAMELAMDMAGAAMPAMPLPTMRMGGDIAVTDVSASGDVSYTVKFTDFSLVNTANVDPNILAAFQGSGFDVKDLSAGATMTNRGVIRNATMDTSKVSNPQMAQVMGSMSSTIQQMASPLPEEPIGVGAQWEVRESLSVNSLRTFQKAVVELVSLDEASCTLKMKMDQTAPAQSVNMPGMPAGMDASLQNMSASGTGTMTIRFDSLVPTSDSTATSSAVMNLNIGGSAQQVSTQTKIHVSVAPSK